MLLKSMFKLKKLTYVLYILCLITLAEAILRWDGRFYQFSETLKTSPPYFNDNAQFTRKKIFVHSPDLDKYDEDRFKEFWYRLTTNSLGLRDIEHPIDKDNHEFRIVCLGDSFTEGYGVSFKDSWPQQLKQLLDKRGLFSKITVIAAGINNSDPFFCYYRLKHLLLPFKPDLVLLQMNSTDMGDSGHYGGLERFESKSLSPLIKRCFFSEEVPPEDTQPFVFHRWSLPQLVLQFFCRYSHLVRGSLYFFHMDTCLCSTIQDNESVDDVYQQYGRLLQAFDQLGQENRFKFVTIFFPMLKETMLTSWYRHLDKVLPGNQTLNLYPFFEAMSLEEKQGYYWPLDSHFNEKGYRVFAEQVAQFLVTYQLVPVDRD